MITDCLAYADILKISEEEFEFITGESDFRTHSKAFVEKHGITLLCVTLGPKGAYYFFKGSGVTLPTYDVKVVDTTGSGDAFTGALLNQICRLGCKLDEIGPEQMRDIMAFANASGSYTAQAKGGIPAIPNQQQVLDCMQKIPLLN